jgi:hypothetical protein
MRFGDLAFNVPFLLYAPGLFESQIRLPYVTSHVDLAPTLLHLVGISEDSLLQHGENMLDERLRDRTTFMLNNIARPIDGFHRNGYLFALNRFTGQVTVTRGPDAPPGRLPPELDGRASASPAPPTVTRDVRRTIERADGIFDTTAAVFLQRAAAHAARPASPASTSSGARAPLASTLSRAPQ